MGIECFNKGEFLKKDASSVPMPPWMYRQVIYIDTVNGAEYLCVDRKARLRWRVFIPVTLSFSMPQEYEKRLRQIQVWANEGRRV